MKFYLLPILFLTLQNLYCQDAARNWTVQLTAEIEEAPFGIRLNWLPNESESANKYVIYRKNKGDYGWGAAIAEVDEEVNTFLDNEAIEGQSYEYYIEFRLGLTIYGWGVINAGASVQMEPNKGDLLLVIDENVGEVLASEISTLTQDLYTDGWMVTQYVADELTTVSTLKEAIIDYYNELPNLKAIYLLGDIPVPYSGELYPDAHDNHIGAWPADVFYGDIDGEWTDTEVNNTTASSVRNHNIPGDGKYDQSKVPSHVELQVSRVDFSDLPVFESDEIDLLRDYLDRAHEFKVANYIPSERGLVDQGGFTGYTEGFAQNGFRNFTSFFGNEEVHHIDYWSNLTESDYLWSYGCGAGSYTSCAGINDGGALNSSVLAASSGQSTFTMLFGSYFGDWDVTNNLMRSAVANGKTLSCSWAGRPNWYYHHMAMGENIGFAAKISQDLDSDYPSLLLGGGDFVTGEGVHVAQLGDPSLRMYYVQPPTELLVSTEADLAVLNWTASADPEVDGYNVYRRTVGPSLWIKLNSTLVETTSFIDETVPDAGDYLYLVKAVKRKDNASGWYWNESLGIEGEVSFYVNINEEKQVDLKIYPNPSTGEFTITTNRPMNLITVSSFNGTIVYQEKLQNKSVNIHLNHLSKGAYIVELIGDSYYKKERIVIL